APLSRGGSGGRWGERGGAVWGSRPRVGGAPRPPPPGGGGGPPRQSRRLKPILCLDDFEPAARRFLPRSIFGYIAGGVETDWSLRANRTAFERYAFTPRMLVDVSQRTTAHTLFGYTYDAPFGIAPMGASG